MASEISIIIPGSRFSSSVRAIERNGTPPYAKTITERTGVIQTLPGNIGAVYPKTSWMNSLKKMTGTERTSDTQNRRRNIPSWPVWSVWAP